MIFAVEKKNTNSRFSDLPSAQAFFG